MVFSSMVFMYAFLPAALLGFYLLPRRFRNLFLLLANLVFYGWGEPVYILIMLAETLVCYAAGLAIGKTGDTSPRAARMACAAACVFGIVMLGSFKYAGLIAKTLRLIPLFSAMPVPDIALPIGISFYTFQTMSYVIDVYRKDVPAQRRIVDFAMYVTLFPQLIAGPIVRYKDVADQIDGNRASKEPFAAGVRLFVIGLGKRVLIANRMGAVWDILRLNAGAYGSLAAWFGVIAYTLQIYFDFSGYSDMARGLGRMFGFEFNENFRYPYISRSITEFWRRWHISLSTWFRDYVYIPLGGSRCSAGRRVFNLLCVWLLTGLWHGASWNFVLWGLYYFLLLALEKAFLGRIMEKLPKAAGHIYTLFAVMIGWVIFALDGGTGELAGFLSCLFAGGALSGDALNLIVRSLPIVGIAAAGAAPLGAAIWKRIEDTRAAGALEAVLCLAVLVFCAAALAGESYNPFLYFRF